VAYAFTNDAHARVVVVVVVVLGAGAAPPGGNVGDADAGVASGSVNKPEEDGHGDVGTVAATAGAGHGVQARLRPRARKQGRAGQDAVHPAWGVPALERKQRASSCDDSCDSGCDGGCEWTRTSLR